MSRWRESVVVVLIIVVGAGVLLARRSGDGDGDLSRAQTWRSFVSDLKDWHDDGSASVERLRFDDRTITVWRRTRGLELRGTWRGSLTDSVVDHHPPPASPDEASVDVARLVDVLPGLPARGVKAAGVKDPTNVLTNVTPSGAEVWVYASDGRVSVQRYALDGTAR